MTAHRLAIIGAPTSAGAYAPGQEKAPAAFRAHGIVDAMRGAGWDVRDLGDVAGTRWRSDPARPKAMNLAAVRAVAVALSDKVAQARQAGEKVLVLGGDCTVELGSVAGALGAGRTLGLIYIDLDTDLNPPSASDGALDWTGVAHLLDVDGAARELSALGPRRPMLSPRDVLFLGVDPATQTTTEQALMRAHRLECVPVTDVQRHPEAAVRRAVEWGRGFDDVAVHLDVDILSFTNFPIAENVRRQNGLSLPELARLLHGILRLPNVATLTITEVNPDHAPDEAATFGRLIAAIAAAAAP